MALIEKQQHIKRRQIIFAVVCLFSLKKIVYNDKKIRGGKFMKIIRFHILMTDIVWKKR